MCPIAGLSQLHPLPSVVVGGTAPVQQSLDKGDHPTFVVVVVVVVQSPLKSFR